MGRGKVEIKRIENSSNRQVTYSKRKNGIIKKAQEITTLCDAKVFLLMFASSGKMHEFCSSSTTLDEVLDRYHKQSGNRLWDAEHESLKNEIDRIKKENDSMKVELRHLKGQDLTSLSHRELMALVQGLENGINTVREKQVDYCRMMEQKTQDLEDECKHLGFILQQEEMSMEGDERGQMENAYHHQERLMEYNSQMPFPLMMHPIHPNLQNKM